ncbi:MAG: hypothetical protein D6768_11770, partial [Chloroflexi bacterium]
MHTVTIKIGLIFQKRAQATAGLLAVLALLLACTASPELVPTPEPTATRVPPAPRNENVEALNSAREAIGKFNFGLAPLLLQDETTIELRDSLGSQTAWMNYPVQSADPREWPGVDSFVLSYAVRKNLLNSVQVSRVTLGQIDVPASVENRAQIVQHTAVWVTFLDGSRAIVDLSPLSTNFAPRHIPNNMLVDNNELENTFAVRRGGVALDQLQPMAVVTEAGNLYYLLAQIAVNYDRYVFSLHLYPVQPADPMRPLEISPGVTASVEIARTDFLDLQQLLRDSGPAAFENHPELLLRRGRANKTLTQIMDDNLHLLWHLVTKFQHQLPDPSLPTPTPIPTATPTPSPTPT